MPLRCVRIKKRFRPSVPCFTSCLCMFAIIVTVSCTVSISEMYNMEATKMLAKSTATAMASTAHQKVDSFMNNAYNDANSLQFNLVMTQRSLPTDGVASGRYTNYTWPSEYLSACAMMMRGVDFQYGYISYSFADGSAAICQRGSARDTFETVSSFVLPNSDTARTATTAYTFEGKFVNRFWSDESYDSRNRTWFAAVPKVAMSKKWFPIGFVGLMPAASLVATMMNGTGVFLGAISVTFSIEGISTLLAQARPFIGSDIFVLDGKYAVVGSTCDEPTFVSRPVPNSYVLTRTETTDGCILSDTGSEADYALVTCHHTILSYQYMPLRAVYNNHRTLLEDVDNEVNVDRVQVGREHYYVSVMSLSYSSLSEWRIVCFLSEKEITSKVVAGRTIVIWVTVVIVIVVGTVSTVAASILLRPLSRIAKLMSSAAYLASPLGSPGGKTYATDETDSTDFSPTSDEEQARRAKAEAAHKELLKERTLSFWRDVRSIQQAYWAMADQVGDLQGYIPEHVRDGIVEHHQQQHSLSKDQGNAPEPSVFGSASQTAAFTPKEGHTELDDNQNSTNVNQTQMKNMNKSKNAESANGSFSDAIVAASRKQSPRLDYDALQAVGSTELIPLADHFSTIKIGRGSRAILSSDDGGVAHRTLHPIPSVSVPSTKMGGDDTLDGETFEDVSVAAARIAYGVADATPTPIIFGDNVLVDRDITIVHINILQFHTYAQATHGRTITEEHEVIVSYIYNAARKCGGNLENFIGDKFWISFNATSRCQDGQIAAASFASDVCSVMNRDALAGQYRRRINHERRVQNLAPLPATAHPRHRFRAAPFGVSCGISTGRAFVGPLGTKAIKRHSILSNAFSEAAALERLSLRYPGCSVMIGGDMIPAIDGYFQYLIIDASLLPGSGGKRRRIANLKGPMLAAGRNPQLHRGGIRRDMPFSPDNPYKGINDCFNAFLEGRTDDCARTLREVDEQTTQMGKKVEEEQQQRQVSKEYAHISAQSTKSSPVPRSESVDSSKKTSSKDREVEKDETQSSSTNQIAPASFISSDSEEQCAEIGLMSRLLWSILTAPTPVDGRVYRSPFGEVYTPTVHALRLVLKQGDLPSQQQAVPSKGSHTPTAA